MTKRNALRIVAALAVGGGLTFALPALPAVGSHSPPTVTPTIEIGNRATLVAGGAAVLVKVEVVCGPDGGPFANVEVTQAVGNSIASGFGSEDDIVCDGTPQTVELLVAAEGFGGRAFRQGQALAEADLFLCDQFGCLTASDTEVIRIVRGRGHGSGHSNAV